MQKDPNNEGGLGWCEGFVLSGYMCFEKIIIFFLLCIINNEHMLSDGTYMK
jgi:hypothetical protein